MKDPLCGGDYTVEGKLLSFCPDCGDMLPFLDMADPPERLTVTRAQKREIGVKLAKIHNLDYKEMYRLVQEIDGDDFEESLRFRMRLVFGVEIEFDKIKAFILGRRE